MGGWRVTTPYTTHRSVYKADYYAQTCPLGFTINLPTNNAKNNVRMSVLVCGPRSHAAFAVSPTVMSQLTSTWALFLAVTATFSEGQ